MKRKIYLIAGEPSGDLHGAHLVEALKKESSEFLFRGFGGPKMAVAGVDLDQTIDRLSFMGFSEVVKHLPEIRSNFKMAKKAIRQWKPDAIVYIDFPGFNMRMAKWAKKMGFRNFYYIAPQAWAWKAGRALNLKRDIDEMFCILPFEKSFFAKHHYDVHYVGHPLVDIVRNYRISHHFADSVQQTQLEDVSSSLDQDQSSHEEIKIMALLPGSREQEVRKILPIQIKAVRDMVDYQLIIGKSSHVSRDIYEKIALKADLRNISYEEDTYALLDKAYMACVASGTATLETALFKVPEVVCFKGSMISYLIARLVIKVSYISLVNLIMDDNIVEELIQHHLTPLQLRQACINLTIKSKRQKMCYMYDRLEEKLGGGGAAEKTAKIMISKLEN